MSTALALPPAADMPASSLQVPDPARQHGAEKLWHCTSCRPSESQFTVLGIRLCIRLAVDSPCWHQLSPVRVCAPAQRPATTVASVSSHVFTPSHLHAIHAPSSSILSSAHALELYHPPTLCPHHLFLFWCLLHLGSIPPLSCVVFIPLLPRCFSRLQPGHPATSPVRSIYALVRSTSLQVGTWFAPWFGACTAGARLLYGSLLDEEGRIPFGCSSNIFVRKRSLPAPNQT